MAQALGVQVPPPASFVSVACTRHRGELRDDLRPQTDGTAGTLPEAESSPSQHLPEESSVSRPFRLRRHRRRSRAHRLWCGRHRHRPRTAAARSTTRSRRSRSSAARGHEPRADRRRRQGGRPHRRAADLRRRRQGDHERRRRQVLRRVHAHPRPRGDRRQDLRADAPVRHGGRTGTSDKAKALVDPRTKGPRATRPGRSGSARPRSAPPCRPRTSPPRSGCSRS